MNPFEVWAWNKLSAAVTKEEEAAGKPALDGWKDGGMVKVEDKE